MIIVWYNLRMRKEGWRPDGSFEGFSWDKEEKMWWREISLINNLEVPGLGVGAYSLNAMQSEDLHQIYLRDGFLSYDSGNYLTRKRTFNIFSPELEFFNVRIQAEGEAFKKSFGGIDFDRYLDWENKELNEALSIYKLGQFRVQYRGEGEMSHITAKGSNSNLQFNFNDNSVIETGESNVINDDLASVIKNGKRLMYDGTFYRIFQDADKTFVNVAKPRFIPEANDMVEEVISKITAPSKIDMESVKETIFGDSVDWLQILDIIPTTIE